MNLKEKKRNFNVIITRVVRFIFLLECLVAIFLGIFGWEDGRVSVELDGQSFMNAFVSLLGFTLTFIPEAASERLLKNRYPVFLRSEMRYCSFHFRRGILRGDQQLLLPHPLVGYPASYHVGRHPRHDRFHARSRPQQFRPHDGAALPLLYRPVRLYLCPGLGSGMGDFRILGRPPVWHGYAEMPSSRRGRLRAHSQWDDQADLPHKRGMVV